MVRSVYGSEDARAIHRSAPAIDLHADTLMWSDWLGYDLHRRHTPPLPKAALGGHVDVPRMREGGMGAQFFGLVSLPWMRDLSGMGAAVDAQIDKLGEACATRNDLQLVRTTDEIVACNAAGQMAALLGIEGAHALDGKLDRLAHFANRGVRYIGILHFSANEAGYPAFGRGRSDSKGLTPWGLQLISAAESLGVIVDLSHLNRRGFLDACGIAKKPVIVSHTGILGAFDHWRNIDDAQLKAVANTGGCVGVIFCPKYLGGDGIAPVVKHINHIVNVVGEDGPALGSDWDGFIVPTNDLRDVSRLPLLTDALLKDGWTVSKIEKLLRTNALRVLSDSPLPHAH